MPPLRSQPTRDKILEAARAVFAQCGYERATIRGVAAEAGIHPSMVTRYYKTKAQLFMRAAQFDIGLPDLTGADRSSLGAQLMHHFLERWEGRSADGQLQALLRAAVSQEAARAKLISIFEGQVCAAIDRLKVDRSSERAALIASQILGLAFGRYVLRIPSLAAIEPEAIVEIVGPTIQSYLDRTLPPQFG